MPNIATYTNNVPVPKATSMGSEAFEIEGRHIESSFAQAGQAIGSGLGELGATIQKHDELQDTSANGAAGAAAFNDLSTKLSQAATDAAADPKNVEKHFQDFQDSLNQTLSTIGTENETSEGKANAERVQNTLREEFTRQAISARSVISGQVVTTNLNQTVNNLSQALSNNPTLWDGAKIYFQGQLEDQLKAHQLSPEETVRIRSEFGAPAMKQLGIATFQAMAEKNPQSALAALKAGQFSDVFNGQEVGLMTGYANAQSRAQDADVRRAQEDAIKAEKLASEDQSNKWITSFSDPNSGKVAVPTDALAKILADPKLDFADKRELMGTVDRLNTPQAMRTDPDILTNAIGRVGATDNPLTQNEALSLIGRGITIGDYNFLHELMNPKVPTDTVAAKMFNQRLAQARATLISKDTITFQSSPAGEEAYSNFLSWFMPAYQMGLKQGKSPEGLLGEGPDSLLGKNAAKIGTFSAGPEDSFQAQLKANQQTAAPTKTPPANRPSLDKIFGGAP